MTVKCQPQDIPLQRIGVLEFVDQGNPVAIADATTGAWPMFRIGEHIVQQHQQIVEIAQSGEAFAPLGFRAHRSGERDPLPRRTLPLRHQYRVPILHRRQCQRMRLLQRKRRFRTGIPVQIQVIGDRADQIIDRLHQPRSGIMFARQAELIQHALAETVGRRNSPRIEIRKRAEQSSPTSLHLRRIRLRHQANQLIGMGAGGLRIGQCRRHRDEPVPRPFPQFLCGGPTERHQQQLRNIDPDLGDIPHRQPDDRMRLTGPRTRLEHRGSGRQRPIGIESVGVQRGRDECGFLDGHPRCPFPYPANPVPALRISKILPHRPIPPRSTRRPTACGGRADLDESAPLTAGPDSRWPAAVPTCDEPATRSGWSPRARPRARGQP